jgi:hypothetical protein
VLGHLGVGLPSGLAKRAVTRNAGRYAQRMPTESGSEDELESEAQGDALGGVARVGAVLFGVGLATAGAWSVFVGTNQAGSVSLLTIGGISFLYGVNGAPVVRAKAKDYEVRLASVRRRAVFKAQSEAPDEALRTIKAAASFDLESHIDPQFERAAERIYGDAVRDALDRIAPTGTAALFIGYEFGVDWLFDTTQGRIGIETIFSSEARPYVIGSFRRLAPRLNESGLPGVIIVATEFPASGSMSRRYFENAATIPHSVAIWNGSDDDDNLKVALSELMAQLRKSDDSGAVPP